MMRLLVTLERRVLLLLASVISRWQWRLHRWQDWAEQRIAPQCERIEYGMAEEGESFDPSQAPAHWLAAVRRRAPWLLQARRVPHERGAPVSVGQGRAGAARVRSGSVDRPPAHWPGAPAARAAGGVWYDALDDALDAVDAAAYLPDAVDGTAASAEAAAAAGDPAAQTGGATPQQQSRPVPGSMPAQVADSCVRRRFLSSPRGVAAPSSSQSIPKAVPFEHGAHRQESTPVSVSDARSVPASARVVPEAAQSQRVGARVKPAVSARVAPADSHVTRMLETPPRRERVVAAPPETTFGDVEAAAAETMSAVQAEAEVAMPWVAHIESAGTNAAAEMTEEPRAGIANNLWPALPDEVDGLTQDADARWPILARPAGAVRDTKPAKTSRSHHERRIRREQESGWWTA